MDEITDGGRSCLDTIVEYLERERRDFTQCPFNEVDSLVLSSLCYCNFELGKLASTEPYEQVELCQALCGVPFDELLRGSWMSDMDGAPRFMAAVLQSPRFNALKVGYFVHETLENIEKQFSAITFFFPDSTAYMAFRGTDGTLAGWKEDFNLCFRTVVPSQRSAARYLSGIASASTGALILGGHSKGGNLSEYAALTAQKDAYNRIVGIYNHDGPSFCEDPSPRIDDHHFQDILHKTVPESSVFGMILERRHDYDIVESTAFAFMQHAPLTWIVEGDAFLRQEQLSASAGFFDQTLNDWCLSFTPEERGRFIDTVYEMLKSTDAKTWAEFQSNLPRNMKKVLKQAGSLDDDTKQFVIDVMGAIARVTGSEAFNRMRNQLPTLPQRSAAATQTPLTGKTLSNLFGRNGKDNEVAEHE